MSEPEKTSVRLKVDDVGKIPGIVDTYLKGNNPPDLVLLQLDLEKFPRRTMDFPEDVRKYVMTHPMVKIEWDNIQIHGFEKFKQVRDQTNENKKSRIVVTMTSWVKRIGNCARVVQSILDSTVKPNIVFLNLSTVEFPNKEQDLPQDLVQLRNDNPEFIINWVEGPNTKTMKKVFPILDYIDDDDIIIYIDDDIIVPPGLVESRISDFKDNSCRYAISGNRPSKKYVYKVFTEMTGIQFSSKSSPTSLITKRMLRGYESFYRNQDVYERAADDSLYTLLCTLNGFSYVPCSDYCITGSTPNKVVPNFNSIDPLHESGIFQKAGYSQENVYITLILYFSIVSSIVGAWNSDNYHKVLEFRRLPKYENQMFVEQTAQFKTVDISQSPDQLTYWYFSGKKPNAGDDYNKYLVEKLYGCKLKYVNDGSPDICLCGSILTNKHMSNCRRVFGCGIQRISDDMVLPIDSSFKSVRGIITKMIVSKQRKIDDDIFLCDPGIVLSRLYCPSKEIAVRHVIGIIPHYVDEDKVKSLYGDKFHIISMVTNDIEDMVDDILSCEIVLSSSLHGIIFSHSYGVPAYHIEFTDFFGNGNFKFQDYYSAFPYITYKKFKCRNFNIDFTRILKFHMEHRFDSNPSMEQIHQKQDEFLKRLPYKNYVNPEIQLQIANMVNTPI